MDIQQGDVKLFNTLDGGEISVSGGIVEMSGGLETSVYLSLFGGNEDDQGRADDPFTWWGNLLENSQASTYTSNLQHIMQSLPLVSKNLRLAEQAALKDLQYLLDLQIANVVTVEATIPGLNKIDFNIKIEARGEETEFRFTENWKQTAVTEAVETPFVNAGFAPVEITSEGGDTVIAEFGGLIIISE